MSSAETVGLSVADIIAHISALGPIIAALGIWFFGFVMWGQNRSRAAQAAEDAKATQAIMGALKEAAEDRKAMQEHAAEDRKAISTLAHAALQTAHAGQQTVQAATQEITKTAEEREKTLELQIQTLQALITLTENSNNPRGPTKWSGQSQTGPTE